MGSLHHKKVSDAAHTDHIAHTYRLLLSSSLTTTLASWRCYLYRRILAHERKPVRNSRELETTIDLSRELLGGLQQRTGVAIHQPYLLYSTTSTPDRDLTTAKLAIPLHQSARSLDTAVQLHEVQGCCLAALRGDKRIGRHHTNGRWGDTNKTRHCGTPFHVE